VFDHNPAIRIPLELSGVRRFAGSRAAAAYALAIGGTLGEIRRSHTLGSADRIMERRAWPYRFQGVPVRYREPNFGMLRELLGRRVYTRAPEMFIRPEDTVVDLGANFGFFTTAAAAVAKAGRVVAVEAQGGMIPAIQENVALNSATGRVDIVHAAIGASTGWFAIHEGRDGSHYQGTSRLLTMAELRTEFNLPRIDFLKIDIEGGEFALFQEDLSWLEGVSRIAMEVHVAFGDPVALRRTLEQRGFKTWTARGESFLYGMLRKG
jgi:FkbM family methyltransferase